MNTTASGEDAVEIIQTSKPDLVFLDLALPEMSGKEILRKLREHDKKTKVVILTGHTLESEDEDKEFKSLGISAYINKPVVLDQLDAIVNSVLGDKFSAKDFEKFKLVRKIEPVPASSMRHRLKNLIGNIRSQCEVFLLNKRDGIYADKSQEELEQMSDKIMQDVIETVDQITKVLEDDQK